MASDSNTTISRRYNSIAAKNVIQKDEISFVTRDATARSKKKMKSFWIATHQNMHIRALQKRIPVSSMTFFNKYHRISCDALSSAHCTAPYSKYISVGLFSIFRRNSRRFFQSPPETRLDCCDNATLRSKRKMGRKMHNTQLTWKEWKLKWIEIQFE